MIKIHSGMLREEDFFESIGPRKVAIITDSNVAKLYGEDLSKKSGSAKLFVFPAGEENKTRATKEKIEDALLDWGFERDDLIISLGGGVVTDLGGFVASTIHRGVAHIAVPTTLLAMTDAAIGGKTGVNLKEGKNLVGTFYQPHAVIVDVCTLNSLPISEFIAGLAEVIKYAFTLDPELFQFLIEKRNEILLRTPDAISTIVERSLRNKASIVETDEREEEGKREVLNFGHTVGHAIEICSNHDILHGQAVAIGMVEEARIAVRKGLLETSVLESLIHVLALFGLPTEIPDDVDFNQLSRVMKQDKKVRNGQLTIPMLVGLGQTEMIVDTIDNLNLINCEGESI